MSLFKEQAITVRELDRLKVQYLKAKEVYYSDPNGKTLMSDDEFDALEDKIRAADPRWKGFKAGTQAVQKFKTKEALPIPIFSLDKHKAHSVGRWLSTVDTDVVVSDKLDGAAIELVFEKGVPVKALTRGNGKIGGNISYLIPHMKIPQKVGNKSFILRCEGLFSKSKFLKYKNEFDSARNAASGVMNRQDVHKSVKDLSIVVIQVLHPNIKPSSGLKWAKTAGFTVVPFVVFPASRLNGSNLDTLLMQRKAKSRYALDGLVLTEDKLNIQPKSGNPDWSVAFKANVDTDKAPVTTIKEVQWEVSRHGLLKPVAVYDPVDWDGSKLTRASAFNAKFVNDNGIGPGAKVAILRSGEIIPYIAKILKKARPSVPSVEEFGPYHLDEKGTEYVLDDPKSSPAVRIKKIARFFGHIGVEFLKLQTLTKMYDAGFTSVSRISRASVNDFLKIPGIQVTTAKKLHHALHSVLNKGIPIATLMEASGTFDRGIGTSRIEAIAERYSLLKLAAMPESKQIELVSKIPGFQVKTATLWAEGAARFLKWMELTGITPMSPAKEKELKDANTVIKKSSKLEGVNVSWTGYRDKEQEALVKTNGGQVVPFSSKTGVLIYSRSGKASSKVDKAKAKGIETYTWDQFAAKYRVR